MASMFSLILVIVMAFSSFGGVGAQMEGPVSFDAKVSVNAEALQAVVGGNDAATLKVAEDILNALTLKGVADKEAVELDLFAGQDVLLSLGVKNAEEGSTFASSLLGNNVVFTSKELIEQMKEQMMASAAQSSASSPDMQALMEAVQNLDEEQMQKDCAELEEKLTKAFNEKKGETETGEFTVDEMTFTGKTPVNMNYTEIMELLLNSTKELLSKESFQPIIKAFGEQLDINAEIDKSLEKLQNMAEEEKPVTQIVLYTDADGCEYCTVDMVRTIAATEETPAKEEKVYVGFGTVDSLNRTHVTASADKMNMDIYAVKSEDGSADVKTVVTQEDVSAEATGTRDAAGNFNFEEKVSAKGVDVRIVMKTEGAGTDRTNFAMDIFYGDAEKALASITGSAGKGGEKVSVFEGEGVTVIPMEKLMDSSDTTASSQLQVALMGGIMKGITTLTKNLPEDTASWLTSQIGAMMNPGSGTSAPAGN